MKKILLLLSICIMLNCFVGCGNSFDTREVNFEAGVSTFLLALSQTECNESESETILTDSLENILSKAEISQSELIGNQLIVIESSGNLAVLYFFEKDGTTWKEDEEIFNVKSYIGSGGVTKNKKEGDKCSPYGLYPIDFAFGIKENPGTKLEYRLINDNCYWIDDPLSENYNKWVETENKNWNSAEHLIEHNPSYNYSIVIKYNYENPIPNNGSAIFIHVGNVPTVGCIAVDESVMEKLLCKINSTAQVLIY